MLKRSAKQMVAEANAVVESLRPELAAKLIGDPVVLFVDLREPPEVANTGMVEGAVNVPRGVLEFKPILTAQPTWPSFPKVAASFSIVARAPDPPWQPKHFRTWA